MIAASLPGGRAHDPVTALLTILRPAEAGGPYDVTDSLTIFEAGVLYRDGFPDEGMLAQYLDPNYPGGRNLAEGHHGIGVFYGWMPEEFRNPAPRDVYLQLIEMVTRGALAPIRAAYFSPGEIDPFRTVIPLTAVLALGRSRGDAGSIIAGLASWYGLDLDAPRPRRRKPAGVNFANADQPLLEEMRRLIDAGAARGPHDAALEVSDRADGYGTLQSKAKRLATRYSAAFGPERD